MDCFAKLPPEIRVQIFTEIRSTKRMLSLIEASPVMLCQYVASKSVITRNLVMTDLDNDMLQDAMAIVLFPKRERLPRVSKEWPQLDTKTDPDACDAVLGESIVMHLQRWGNKAFRHPFQVGDGQLADQLSRLHGRILFFIEDYITKATAPFPPREYLCVPSLVLFRRELTFKGDVITTRFDESDLRPRERSRLLRAFLRHELLCRVDLTMSRISARQGYLKALSQLLGPNSTTPFEREAILSISDYMTTLYVAIGAQFGNFWLPEIPVGTLSSQGNGLLYPDCLLVDACCYRTASPVLEGFSKFGVSHAAEFLKDVTVRNHSHSKIQARATSLDVIYHQKWSGGPFMNLRGACDASEMHPRARGSGIYETLWPQLTSRQQRLIYRQRAWAFLDDQRLHRPCVAASGSAFPTPQELDELEYETASIPEFFLRPSVVRESHRSQQWHDDMCKTSNRAQTPM